MKLPECPPKALIYREIIRLREESTYPITAPLHPGNRAYLLI